MASVSQFLVPAYFYPVAAGSDWDVMTTSARTGVAVTAVMNPNSGPLDERNADYVRAINGLRGAGGKVIGYLPSSYAGRQFPVGTTPTCPTTAGRYTPQDLIDCARRYKTNYNGVIDGIFIDEMGQPQDGSVTLAGAIDFYRQLYNGLKAIDSSWKIFGNPGAGVNVGYLRNGASGGADVLITFEANAAAYASTVPPAYHANFASTSFGAILHSASISSFPSYLSLARSRNVSYIYAVDRFRSYQYDQLPSNWAAQVTTVRDANR